jgi:hypothetical protein
MKHVLRLLLLDHVPLYLEFSVDRGAKMPMGRFDLSSFGCKRLRDEDFGERGVGQRIETVLLT